MAGVIISPMPVAASTLSGKQRPGEGGASARRAWQPTGAYHDVACTGFAMLAQAPRQGAVHLSVGTGCGLSSARGAAEAEAAEMPVDLGPRERLGHQVCWVFSPQNLEQATLFCTHKVLHPKLRYR